MKFRKLLALAITAVLLCGCGAQSDVEIDTSTQNTSDEVSTEASDDQTATDTDSSGSDETAEAVDEDVDKQVIVYFANWNLGKKEGNAGGEVASIPWESITYINHAFWAVVPNDGSTNTSVEQRQSGEGARKEFTIVSTEPERDYGDTLASDVVEGIERNHFAEYEYFSELYPDVNILISIGGWSKCGYMSEMAYTPEGRSSFINSCIDLMDQYSWIDGIDIDWEYPGGSKDGERQPESETDQGCPIFGTASEDSKNFTLLLSELRAAMDEHFGEGTKRLTACASASTGWTLPMQDWASFAPHVDLINIMTYDLAGLWDGSTGHASSFFSSKGAAVYFKVLEIPMSKLCIGSPMYSTTFLMKEITTNPLGTPIENYKPNSTDIVQSHITQFEADAVSGYTIVKNGDRYEIGESFDNGGTGWHMCYDEGKGAAYMYNDDEASEYYKWFISYENPLSLQAKLEYIKDANLSGIIVWESSQDTVEHKLITQMGDSLLEK